ncbi:MAG TPA: T9SS type A sorting domain-containing protein [Bacteroidia bacterium]|jgi:hypothetical protein
MKNLSIILLFILCSEHSVFAQNTYDIYNSECGTYSAIDPDISQLPNTPILGDPIGSYLGEYQIFLNQHSWRLSPSLIGNAISYKIEVVSFPFTPNCASCQSFFPATADRKLRMPDDQFPYDALQDAWVRNTIPLTPVPTSVNATNDYLLRREFKGEYGAGMTGEISGDIHFSSLASKGMVRSDPPSIEYHDQRVFYPHSVLKHTFYMHCGNSTADEIIDSIVFVIDHTRGRMRYYPFIGTNTNSDAFQHDITIAPKWTDPFYVGAVLNTIDYYPLLKTPSTCQNHFPTDGTSAWDPDSYIRPQPHSLLQYFLGNYGGNAAAGYLNPNASDALPGIPHTYIIDRPIDLTLLNPSEKIIYNPSEVDIDLNQPYNTTPESKMLTFPSGYTFKTVNGRYPTVSEVEAGDPNNMYYHLEDINPVSTLACDDVGSATDTYLSYYRIKNGSTLMIEPCVRLFDVQIEVEPGAHLYYNPTEISGRHYNIVNMGGTIHSPFVGTPSYSTCPFNCYEVTRYDLTDLIINANETWGAVTAYTALDATGDGKIQIAGTVTVKSGKVLTINGPLRLEFGENGRMLVERGAKLIINGPGVGSEVVLTSAEFCNKSMWQGIQVLGNKFAAQGTVTAPSSSQGFLYLHQVVIENARIAIKMGVDGSNTFNGGVLHSTSTSFKNNFVDIEFKPYSRLIITPTGISAPNYAATIQNCTFETTRVLNDPRYIAAGGRPLACDKHVVLNGVKNVKINGNKFENNAVNSFGVALFDEDARGTGIYSIDSYIGLTGGSTANMFKGLSEGLLAKSTGGVRFISIVGNHFQNNIHGIVLEATKLTTINSNDFAIPASMGNPILQVNELLRGYNKPVGLYLIGVTDFTAQENVFTSYGALTSTSKPINQYNYGMVVNNCSGSTPLGFDGSGIGQAYKNTFSNLNINIQPELDNLAPAIAGGGFEYKCNNFINRFNNDLFLPDVPASTLLTSLIRDQGACISAVTQAGNSYAAGSGYVQMEFAANSAADNSGFQYSEQPGIFNYTNISSSINNCSPSFGLSSCLSNLSSICAGDISCLLAAYNSAKAIAVQKQIDLDLLIDGGNTGSLTSAISSSMTPGSLKNLLLSKSPYLSDEVLVATLSRNDLPPYGHLEQIFIANSPVTVPVISTLQNIGLPSGIINNILSVQTGVSARSEKEKEVDYYAFQSQLTEMYLKQAYLSIENIDSLKRVSEKDSTLAGLFKQIEILIEQGNYTDAHVCIEKIHSKEEVGIHSDKCRLSAIRLYLAENELSWFDMTADQYAEVKQVYENNPELAIEARTILSLTRGLQYARYPYDATSVRNMSFTDDHESTDNNNKSDFLVYPNPTSDFIKVEISSAFETSKVELIIYNIVGAIVYKQIVATDVLLSIDVKSLTNGIYFFILNTDRGTVGKQKIIVSR